ncbi:MAG: restriction endonuclease [Nitrososphaerota archaeon]|nr:restriction endonuclease [Nitrososphaerota archaeon]
MAKIEKERIGLYLKTALQILEENAGQLASGEVTRETGRRIHPTDYENAILERTGYVRWQSYFHFYSINLTKAGWILKKKGVWYITPEGSKALKLSPKEIVEISSRKYQEWKDSHPSLKHDLPQGDEVTEEQQPSAYEKSVDLARQEIRDFINALDPYEFQDLVAALLRGMGYHTPFVAPKGRSDGGVDILAYKDPFGTEAPRIKVQVKHKEEKAAAKDIRQLSGSLNKDGDTGLFVSSSGFTQDAIVAIRNANRHIEKLDLDTFINYWEEHFDKMTEEDQALLPLRRIAFLAPNE